MEFYTGPHHPHRAGEFARKQSRDNIRKAIEEQDWLVNSRRALAGAKLQAAKLRVMADEGERYWASQPAPIPWVTSGARTCPDQGCNIEPEGITVNMGGTKNGWLPSEQFYAKTSP